MTSDAPSPPPSEPAPTGWSAPEPYAAPQPEPYAAPQPEPYPAPQPQYPPPGSTPWYPPPGYLPPPAPGPQPEWLKGLLITVGVVAGLVVLCCVGGLAAVVLNSGSDRGSRPAIDEPFVPDPSPSPRASASGSASATPSAQPTVETAVGTPVRDGTFEFVVRGVKCGRSSVGDEIVSKNAQGQFCVVSASVKNVGDKPEVFFSQFQRALDANGTEFASDSEATFYLALAKEANPASPINPGNTTTCEIVYDIPKGAVIAKLELHGAPSSPGARVKVG